MENSTSHKNSILIGKNLRSDHSNQFKFGDPETGVYATDLTDEEYTVLLKILMRAKFSLTEKNT